MLRDIMKRTLSILGLLFFLFFCFFSIDGVRASEKNDRPFVELFHERGTGFYVITGVAKQYIDTCCKDKRSAINLLEDNHFHVSIVSSSDDVKRLNEHWKTIDQAYEEFIFARRGAGVLRFWRVFTNYKVVLFIKNGKVARVHAVVDTTMP